MPEPTPHPPLTLLTASIAGGGWGDCAAPRPSPRARMVERRQIGPLVSQAHLREPQ
ncbi:hypothetical protein [Luteococcus japonicus]|uniref:hypothetical protein n=1 Tax=Luteococcus japonicus TaxID=33984 RepID=UPI001475448C|nr:hypothetical protein [Luteococcus japonicus]